jgi:hypothetical protein
MAEQGEPLSCREVVELATDFLEGVLPLGLQVVCELHLAGCPSCLTYLEQLRQTVRLLAQAIEQTVAPATRAALLDRFRALSSA